MKKRTRKKKSIEQTKPDKTKLKVALDRSFHAYYMCICRVYIHEHTTTYLFVFRYFIMSTRKQMRIFWIIWHTHRENESEWDSERHSVRVGKQIDWQRAHVHHSTQQNLAQLNLLILMGNSVIHLSISICI